MIQQNSHSQVINVVFDAGRGQCQTLSREAVTGEPFGELPTAHRAGYTFEGWYTQPDVNGEKVVSGDLVTRDSDLTLYARYVKKTGGTKKKKSSLRTQRRALWGICAAIVVLIIGVIVANYVVSLPDPFRDTDGEVYRSRKVNGAYAILDADGNVLPQNEDKYYLTASGTQLSLDSQTGVISVYAVVDTEGSETVGANSRILMFAQIRQANVAEITVRNQKGSYTFYTDEDGNVQIKGYESNPLVAYNKELYPYLCVGCGYPLTLQKLDTEEVLKHGYAEYGLEPETRTDEDGNSYDYVPTTYTITSKDGVSHSVIIGDPIVSGAGYYVKLAGEENRAVYIMNNDNYDKAVLQPVTSLINATITVPMTLTTYYNVRNFVLTSGTGDDLTIDVAFSFSDLAERANSMYSAIPYNVDKAVYKYKYAGYELNTDLVTTLLQGLYEANIVRICSLDITDEELIRYGLDNPSRVMMFDYMTDTDGDNVGDYPVKHTLMFSERTANGTYYVVTGLTDESGKASVPCLIAEVAESSLTFLEADAADWINRQIFWFNLAYAKSIRIQSPRYNVHFTMDNSASDQSSAVSSANLRLYINGVEPSYTVDRVSPNTGKITKETPVYNLRQFYKALLSISLMELADKSPIRLTEEEMAAFRAMDDSECQLILTVDCEDEASVYNPEHFDHNNHQTLVYRFYRYSEGASYLTINGEGEFCVDATFVEKIISDAQRVEDGILVDASSKN